MSTLKTNSITHISNSGTANISLTNDGKVGIGVTSPDAPLTIHSSSDPEIRFGYSASQDHRIGWDASNLHIHADPENGTASSSIRLYVDGSEKLRINSGGGLLLGTTTAGQSGEADALTIYKNAHTGITIRTGTSHQGSIYFADGTTTNQNYRGTVSYDHSTDSLTFKTSATERLRIGPTGEIGVAGAGSINYGSSGQVLTSGGTSAGCQWTTITGTTINNNADNRVITGSGTANTLEAESSLTWDGSQLDLNYTSPTRFNRFKDNQLRFNSAGTAYLDHYTVGQDIQVRVSGSSSADTNGPKFTSAGNIAFTAGKGIDFSAVSHSGGMTSELLDSYEEGTWTPADGGGIVPFASQNGTYVKVGNMVMASFRLICTTNVTSSASAYIVGLPFTSKNSATPGGMAISYTNSTDDFRTAHVNQNTSHCNFYKHTGANMTKAQMWDGASVSKQLSGTLCYLTD